MLSIACMLFRTCMTESMQTESQAKYCLHAFRTYMTEIIHVFDTYFVCCICYLCYAPHSLGREEKGRITTPIIQLWCCNLKAVPWISAEHVQTYKGTTIASCDFSRLGQPTDRMQLCVSHVWLFFLPFGCVSTRSQPSTPKPKP